MLCTVDRPQRRSIGSGSSSDVAALAVEHAIAELKWWQLQRITGRREVLPETVAAVAGLVSDRMITW
jgi:hypothetical protein